MTETNGIIVDPYSVILMTQRKSIILMTQRKDIILMTETNSITIMTLQYHNNDSHTNDSNSITPTPTVPY